MIRALQNLSLPVRILIYAVAAAAVLAIAAGVGATAALVLGPDGGTWEESLSRLPKKRQPSGPASREMLLRGTLLRARAVPSI
jgi:hypothetical protein